MLKFCFAIAFSVPLVAQSNTVVDVVDISGPTLLGSNLWENFPSPSVPGEVVRVSLDLNLQYFIDATVSNPNINMPLDVSLIRYRLIAFAGGTTTYVEDYPAAATAGLSVDHPIPISMGQSESVMTTWSQSITRQWNWPLDTDESVSLGDGRMNSSNGTPPDGWGFWWNSYFNLLPSVTNDTFQLTGTITWRWEPYASNVIQVCDGDGVMDLQLVGDWGGSVRAVSNHIDNFSLLFRGDFFQHPGSSLCIGTGQRITASLSEGSMDHVLNPGTLMAGQSFTLQAAHRFGVGEVRLSNALLVTPQ